MTTQELKQYIDKVLGNNIRCLLPSYWWKKLFGEVVDNIDSVSKSTKSSIDKLSTRVSKVEEGSSSIVDITYEELCRKKALSELIPGQSYRITDYECTINDEDPTVSATNNEEFCIVVTATSENNISENATATIASGWSTGIDERTAWTLKYALDNDPNRFSWARKGYKDYDVVVSFVDYGDTVTGIFFWDDYSSRYITNINNGDSYYLTSSLDSKEPLQKTTFNYGDTVYVKYFGSYREAKVLYTSNMKDTGDGVVIECHKNNYNPSLRGTYPFIWDPIRGIYKYKTAEDSYDFLEEVSKKDSFSINERFSIRNATEKFEQFTKLSNFDIVGRIPETPTLGIIINWNTELNRYTLSDSSYLGMSENDSTPVSKNAVSTGDTLYIYSPEGEFDFTCQESLINSQLQNDIVLLNYIEGIACAIFQWDEQNKIYSNGITSIVLEDGTPMGKDFDFSSDIKYGIMTKTIEKGSLGDYGLAVGFYVPEGKGVIYYMKDEYNNEAFYDFKNLRFSFPGKSPKTSFSSSKYCFGISIRQSTRENRFTLNKVVFDTTSNSSYPKNIIVSGDVYNQLITNYKDNSYIGLDSNGELITKNIFDDTAEILRQEVIDNEEVTAAALNDLKGKIENLSFKDEAKDEANEIIAKSLNELNEKVETTEVVHVYLSPRHKFYCTDKELPLAANAKVIIHGARYKELAMGDSFTDIPLNLMVDTYHSIVELNSERVSISIPIVDRHYDNTQIKTYIELVLYNNNSFDAYIHETTTEFGDKLTIHYTKHDATVNQTADNALIDKVWEIE